MAEQETTETNPRHFWGILCCGMKANNSVQPANLEQDEKSSYVQNPSVSSSFVSTRSVHRSSQDPGSNMLGEGMHSQIDCGASVVSLLSAWASCSELDEHASPVMSPSISSGQLQEHLVERHASREMVRSEPLEFTSSMGQDKINALLQRRRNAICEKLEFFFYCDGVKLSVLRKAFIHALQGV